MFISSIGRLTRTRLLNERQEIGSIESKKAESSLYAPVAGRLVRFNEELLSDPSAINLDKYGAGWLFEIEATSDTLLDPPGYIKHLAGVWAIAQRTIKGQMNEWLGLVASASEGY